MSSEIRRSLLFESLFKPTTAPGIGLRQHEVFPRRGSVPICLGAMGREWEPGINSPPNFGIPPSRNNTLKDPELGRPNLKELSKDVLTGPPPNKKMKRV